MGSGAIFTVLAFDYGEKRVGTATGNGIARLATPGEVLTNDPDLIKRACLLASGCQADLLVVGLPRNMDGSEGHQAVRAKAFATELRERSGREVVMQDEALSTIEAAQQFPKVPVDAASAAIILERYFDEHPEPHQTKEQT